MDGRGTGAAQVSAGLDHACALLVDSSCRCWGEGTNGRLGYGDEADVSDPSSRADGISVGVRQDTRVVQIAAGEEHTCAVTIHGDVRCWGFGARGQLGSAGGSPADVPDPSLEVLPVQLDERGVQVVHVAVGDSFSCALMADGAVRCFGESITNALGIGRQLLVDPSMQSFSVPLDLEGTSAVQVVAGNAHACALLEGGTIKCWGSNANGQLGQGNVIGVQYPFTVGSIVLDAAGSRAISISAGSFHTCALLDDGAVKCWGGN